MKNIIKSAIAVGLLGLAVSLYAGWISPDATVDGAYTSSVTAGHYVHFQRGGDAEAGVDWTEATLWYPSSEGGNQVLGNAGSVGNGLSYHDGPFNTTEYLSAHSNGVYSIQYRLVDNNIDYQDQWLTFTASGFGDPPR